MCDENIISVPNGGPIPKLSKVLIIGAGWYGCHIAAEIKCCAPHVEVHIFEEKSRIFNGVSGNFGIRLHSGPHYPRSKSTREHCQRGFLEFIERYPELLNDHSYSDYGLGQIDATGQPSKVQKKVFVNVCNEFGNAQEIKLKERNYTSLDFVANIEEPTIILGERLREYFQKYLTELGVKIFCNTKVNEVSKPSGKHFIKVRTSTQKRVLKFNHVINATGYQSLLSPDNKSPGPLLPHNAKLVYQVCIALEYKYVAEPVPAKPFSFIVMDGWFPCLMPYDDRTDCSSPISKYIMTHGKWTILGSFTTPTEANNLLTSLTDQVVETQIRQHCENEMKRFWPEFSDKFKYTGWKGCVLAKLITDTEFRSAITFRSEENGVIYVFPGKINSIFGAAREVLTMLKLRPGSLIKDGNISYVSGGHLNTSQVEIVQKPKILDQNTCYLQTYKELSFSSSKIA